MTAGRGWRGGAAPLIGLCLGLSSLGCASAAAQAVSVSEQRGRSVSWPLRLGWVSSQRASGALPSAVALGGKSAGRVLMYFEFAPPEVARRLLRAELVVTASGAPGSAIDVELAPTEAPSGELRSWADQPRARYPRLSARLVSDSAPVRLDVSEILRAETKPGEPVRLLLRAEPAAVESLLIETGSAGGAVPRLEVYWE